MSGFKLFKSSKYFLVLGAGRGGTSLLTAMLDCNPSLTVGLEQFSFDFLLGNKLEGKKKYDLNLRISSFDKACQKIAKAKKNLWGNKITTEQILALEQCEGATFPIYFQNFLNGTIGKGKVIFIVRDGRSCVQSKINRTQQTYELAVYRWKFSVKLLSYLKENHEQLLVLKYEDLVASPEEQLKIACGFLNVSYNAEMLNGPDNKLLPEMYQNQGLKRESEDIQWPEKWTSDMQVELAALGYEA